MSMGSVIREKRTALGMTQEQLAEKMGVSFETISYWENDEYMPKAGKLVTLAGALQTRVGVLFEDNEEPDYSTPQNDRLFDENHMITYLKSALKDMPQSYAALDFARRVHEGQYRKGRNGGSSDVMYINHPCTMACHCLAMGINDDDIIAAALLHDAVEDGIIRDAQNPEGRHVTIDDLPVGETVRHAVDLLTKKSDRVHDDQYLAEYFEAIAEDRTAAFVKVLDRCNNLSTMATAFDDAKIHEYIEETERYIMPVLDVVKHSYRELNDAAFLMKYHMKSLIEAMKRPV